MFFYTESHAFHKVVPSVHTVRCDFRIDRSAMAPNGVHFRVDEMILVMLHKPALESRPGRTRYIGFLLSTSGA